jgi:carbon monoxide dehydrogenase subunit G
MYQVIHDASHSVINMYPLVIRVSQKETTMTKHDITGFFAVDPLKFTQAPLRAERTHSLNASPEKVWGLISDHEKLPTYISFVQKVTVDNSNASAANGVGAVRTCNIGEIALIEEIRLWEPNRALAYAVRDGNPMGMTGHLGVATLAPNETGGTTVRWQAYFDHPDVDMMTAQVQGGYQQGISGLIEIFGGTEDN